MILVVTEGTKAQERFHDELAAYAKHAGVREPLFYPAWETLPNEVVLPRLPIVRERLCVLRALAHQNPLVVASLDGVLQKTLSAQHLQAHTLTVCRGERLAREEFLVRLIAFGFQRAEKTEQPGDFSVRGGIVDVYAVEHALPIRIEWFGDQVESLRWFDPITQVSMSGSGVTTVEISAAHEWSYVQQHPDQAVPFCSLLPRDSLVILDELCHLQDTARQGTPQLLSDTKTMIRSAEFFEHIRAGRDIRVLAFEKEGEPLPEDVYWEMNTLEFFRPLEEGTVGEMQWRQRLSQLRELQNGGYRVFVLCHDEGQRRRLKEILSELDEEGPPLRMEIAPISQGFLFPDAKLAVISEGEIFGRCKQRRPRALRFVSKSALTHRIAKASELVEGDFVVHLQHGIGKYLGLRKITLDGCLQEVLCIEYRPREEGQPAPKLYVPVDQVDLISKYLSLGKARPELDRLGDSRWARRKSDAENGIRDLASELLKIHAARSALNGFVFAPDTGWQRELEAAFAYEETADQLVAVEEVKRDMESPRPMDRLLCGDVGYGKTEVAIRAAFKAVMSGKQVAVLVPTTVLAQQHGNTFRERMAEYPIKIEVLSRFRTRRQQRAVLAGLREGSVDLVIGTHRLLQADVCFKDLGLVIIDEEQRFGVLHKERLKQMRTLVDVLTLTATPIPRTLYLSLTGVRDISILETPPQDRLPVQTIVCAYDEQVICEAIHRELARQGQVYFLHNRVQTIEQMGKRLRELTPEARIGIAHGQMDDDALEDVMTRFVNGEVDVLLCTTIIENGLDIPNANTILIDRADRLGLAELYQLRGRVGRYKHQAYAYLLLPRHARLIATARKRLSAIRQYSQLGAGFQIAMRDLEIRGAGNILGTEQSGHIAAIGFELYCQLLRESIARLKGEPVRPRVLPELRLDFLSFAGQADGAKQTAAHIPFSYVGDDKQRIEVYRRIAEAREEYELEGLRAELRDRFGALPRAVELLLNVMGLKILCAKRGITVLETRGEKLILKRGGDALLKEGRFPRLTGENPASRLAEIRKLLLSLL